MTPERRAAETANKRAERQRRKEAGYKRVECWLSASDTAWLNSESQRLGLSVSGVVQEAIYFVRRREK